MAARPEDLKNVKEKDPKDQQELYKKELEAVQKYGLSAELLIATKYGDLKKMAEMLKQGVSVDAQATPAGWVTLRENLVFFRVVFTALHPGCTPLMLASYCGNLEAVQFLLKENAKVNLTAGGVDTSAAKLGGFKDFNGYNALMYAAANGHADVVRCLIQSGADIHVVTTFLHRHLKQHTTVFHLTAQNSHEEVLQILLDKLASEVEPLIEPLKNQMKEMRAHLGHYDQLKEVKVFLDKPESSVNLLKQAKELLTVLEFLLKNVLEKDEKFQQELEAIKAREVDLKLKIKQIEELKAILEAKSIGINGRPRYEWTPLQSHLFQSDRIRKCSYNNNEGKLMEEQKKAEEIQRLMLAHRAKRITHLFLKNDCSLAGDRLSVDRGMTFLPSSGYDGLFRSELHRRTELVFFEQTGKPFITNNADIARFKEIRATLTGSPESSDPTFQYLDRRTIETRRFYDLPVDTTLPERYAAVKETPFGTSLPARITELIFEYERNTRNPNFQEDYYRLHHTRFMPLYATIRYEDDSLTGKTKAFVKGAAKALIQTSLVQAPVGLLTKLKDKTLGVVKFGFEL